MSKMSVKISFLLDPFPFRSLGASRCVQRLDRCLRSSQSVIQMSGPGRGGSPGPGPVTTSLLNHLPWTRKGNIVHRMCSSLVPCSVRFLFSFLNFPPDVCSTNIIVHFCYMFFFFFFLYLATWLVNVELLFFPPIIAVSSKGARSASVTNRLIVLKRES